MACRTRQIHDFVEQVVGRPAYLAGNSLGGYVAVQVAARHPSQVLGLLLLNSTPFWSFKPAASGPQGVWGLLPGLDATVPVSEVRSQ
jgi:pimeloyl-ACP methyl ester carboxylesterase